MSGNTRPSLELKRDLIRHAYDSFLAAQARLFVQATSNEEVSDSDEIDRRRELLLLDDLASFAIAARRLIELTVLKSFANRCVVPLAYLDQSEEPYLVMKSKQSIGFLTLMNRLIHASFIQHFSNKLHFVLFITRPPKEVQEAIMLRSLGKHETIEQLLFVSSDKDDPALISIRDMIDQSIKVADKIIDVCSDQNIFLELWPREP